MGMFQSIPRRLFPLMAGLSLLASMAASAQDPYIAAMASEVQRSEVENVIRTLEGFGTRYAFTTQCDTAGAWLFTTLQGYGLTVAYEEFVFSGKTMRNVVARLDGQVSPDKVFIIGAHYDSTSTDPWNNAPGADDNASGVAAVLEAARVLSRYPFENTVEFICFSGEEQGLKGSEANVANALSQGKNIQGMVNLDMIGYFPASSDRELDIGKNAQSAWLADVVEQSAAAYASLPVHNWNDTGVCYDDQASYWNAGIPAVALMDCYEAHMGMGEFTPHYHQTSDTSATLDLDETTEAVRAAVASMAVLAVPVVSPITLYAVKTAVPDDVLLTWVGGAPNFEVVSSTSEDFTAGLAVLTPVSGTPAADWTHAGVMNDGAFYYYRTDRL